MDGSIRYLAPCEHDRVNELLSKYPCEYPKLSTHIQVVKIFKDSKRYIELLEKIENYVLRTTTGFNLIIKNVPEFAQLRDTGCPTRVGREELWETLEQFGKLHSVELIHGTVYAKFDDPEPCHSLINNMQMGNNILRTRIC